MVLVAFFVATYALHRFSVPLGWDSPGYAWRTNCDTEVLLVAYDVWGERCVEKFDGMFAFAIWDAPTSSVFLARDRMGQKPLYTAMAPSSRSLTSTTRASNSSRCESR